VREPFRSRRSIRRIAESKEQQVTAAYLRLIQRFMAILYEEDPEGFGSTIGAPRDEYSNEAAKLAAELRQNQGNIHAALAVWPSSSERLIERITSAWDEFDSVVQRFANRNANLS
jgi:hypothetical protein